MTGQMDLDVELGGILGDPGEWTFDEVREQLAARDDAACSAIETTFGQAGWYGGGTNPYPPPAVPFNAPRPVKPKVVTVERRLWLTRYNPLAQTSMSPTSPTTPSSRGPTRRRHHATGGGCPA